MKLILEIDADNPSDFSDAYHTLTSSFSRMYGNADLADYASQDNEDNEEGGFCGPGEVINELDQALDQALTENNTTDGGIVVPEPIASELEKMVAKGGSIVTTQVIGVELDSEGLPWDVRIHTTVKDENGSHRKNKNGTWRLRKGVDKDLVERVRDEQREALTAPPAEAVAVDPLDPLAPETHAASAIPSHDSDDCDAAVAFATPPVEIPSPPAEQAPPVEIPSPPAEQAPPVESDVAIAFPTVLMFYTEKLSTDKGVQFKQSADKALNEKFMIKTINQIAIRPDLVANVYSELQAIWNKLNTQG